MITTEKHNGWTNWDTWNVQLWLANDERAYRIMRRSTDIERDARELMEIMGNPDDADLDNVDWDEIIGAWEEDE